MTITLCVREVLQDPCRFVENWRLAVIGVLLLHEEDFRIFQFEDGAFDDGVSLPIDDPLAAAKLCEFLPPPPPGGWRYFGPGMVEAWTRHDPGGWVLHEVVSVWLDEREDGRFSNSIKVRPHPWGWDRFE